jgi:menaquinone-dependent protoporphyrinogen oxidase
MSRVLIAYASTHGHTAKIAARIADVLRADGHDVEIHDNVATSDPVPHDYDVAIAGASIHRGHHQDEFVAWALRHGIALNMMPSALFSVCLAAAEDSDESRAATRQYLEDLEERTGWTPTWRTTFAGALQYREYDFMTRLIMRVLMAHGHHPSDTRRDYDFTDWEAVERFARGCVNR